MLGFVAVHRTSNSARLNNAKTQVLGIVSDWLQCHEGEELKRFPHSTGLGGEHSLSCETGKSLEAELCRNMAGCAGIRVPEVTAGAGHNPPVFMAMDAQFFLPASLLQSSNNGVFYHAVLNLI